MKRVLAITGLAVAIAGCGGTNPTQTGTSAGGGNPPKDGVNAAYRFSACMRNHGLTNFPDPIVHSSAGSQSVGIRITPGLTKSPAFASAQKACNSILPAPGPNSNGNNAAQQHRKLQAILAFTHCLHGHGYPNFPDPSAQGRLDPSAIASSGVSVHTPQFFQAARGCLSVTNGAITPAQLAQGIKKIP
jgi:hypothetical protein